MKSASLLAVTLIAQLASSNFISFWPRELEFSIESIQNRSSVPLGLLSSPKEARDHHIDIFERQLVCVDAGYGKFIPFSSEMA
jgi:hypothetical protein